MSDSSPIRKPTKAKSVNLGTQAHEQSMDYLRVADRSTNPAIVKAALSMAQERQRHQQNTEAKISPSLAVGLATCIIVAACLGCSFVVINYPQKIGLEITWLVVTFAVLIICFYGLYSGHLSQANFMSIFKWAGERFNKLNPFGKSAEPVEISAVAADDEATSSKSKNK